MHDFDYEIHPTLDKHPQDGAPILREQGYPEELIEAVLSHAEHLSLPRDTPLKLTLFARRALGLHPCVRTRSTRRDRNLGAEVRAEEARRPLLRLRRDRDDVCKSAEELGVELDEHIAFVTAAMRPIARGARAAHAGGRRLTARFDALGVVVADIHRPSPSTAGSG